MLSGEPLQIVLLDGIGYIAADGQQRFRPHL
jgi:hypothetical protein